MNVPSSNLLSTALTPICPESFNLRKFVSRTTNEIGLDVATYSDPVELFGSVQAVDARFYADFGLDFEKNYIHIWTETQITNVQRLTSPDVIEWNSKRWEVVSDNDWFPVDGWNNFICVEVVDI